MDWVGLAWIGSHWFALGCTGFALASDWSCTGWHGLALVWVGFVFLYSSALLGLCWLALGYVSLRCFVLVMHRSCMGFAWVLHWLRLFGIGITLHWCVLVYH